MQSSELHPVFVTPSWLLVIDRRDGFFFLELKVTLPCAVAQSGRAQTVNQFVDRDVTYSRRKRRSVRSPGRHASAVAISDAGVNAVGSERASGRASMVRTGKR